MVELSKTYPDLQKQTMTKLKLSQQYFRFKYSLEYPSVFDLDIDDLKEGNIQA